MRIREEVEATLWKGPDPETLVSFVPVEVNLPKRAERPEHALARAGGVTDPRRLGSGPLTAAILDPWNAHPELRRYIDVYGRDAAEAADAVAHVYPGVTRGIFLFAAAYQADQANFWQQSFPGSYPHRVRHTIDAGFHHSDIRQYPFHGARDATVLNLKNGALLLTSGVLHPDDVVRYPLGDPRAGEVVMHNGNALTVERSVLAAARGVINELRHGFFWTPSNMGKEGWCNELDSYNAYTDWDGRLPEVPVAEVNGQPEAWLAPLSLQAQTYEAFIAVADYLEARGIHDGGIDADGVRETAARVKEAVLRDFLVEDDPQGRGRYFGSAVHELAMGAIHPITGEKIESPGRLHVLHAIRNIQGDLLRSGMLDAEKPNELELIKDIVRQLTHERLLTPIGLRGRSNDDPRYTPHDYHSGAWAQRTLWAAIGHERYGLPRLAAEFKARAMQQTRDGRYPESSATEGDPICRHILTVESRNPVGQIIHTVKERPAQSRQTWCIATAVAIDHGANQELPPTDPAMKAFEDEILAGLPEHIFRGPDDLRWNPNIEVGYGQAFEITGLGF